MSRDFVNGKKGWKTLGWITRLARCLQPPGKKKKKKSPREFSSWSGWATHTFGRWLANLGEGVSALCDITEGRCFSLKVEDSYCCSVKTVARFFFFFPTWWDFWKSWTFNRSHLDLQVRSAPRFTPEVPVGVSSVNLMSWFRSDSRNTSTQAAESRNLMREFRRLSAWFSFFLFFSPPPEFVYSK